MKPKRHVLLAAFLVATAVFVWGCFYIPDAQFHRSVQIGEHEYGLCHIKSMIYFAVGGSRLYVSSAVAAAAVALAVGLPAFVLISLATRLWSRTHKHEPRMA
jgi:hypothetical protein